MSALQNASLLDIRLNTILTLRRQNGTLRELDALVPNTLIDFSSNDYLGFAHNKRLTMHASSPAIGATGSRLLSGNSEFCMALEKELAAFYHSESALLFNSGYAANLGVLASLFSIKDLILYDEYVHNSCREGLRLSRAKKSIAFRHNDVQDLKRLLSLHESESFIFIVIEAIYSMDGDEAPLMAILALCEKFPNAYVIIDEAHSGGVYGEFGSGFVQTKLGNMGHPSICCRIFTFGKALGYHGAIVCGSHVLISYLINYARPFVYSTALPNDALLHIQHAHYLCKYSGDLREKLFELVSYFREKIQACDAIPTDALLLSPSPIQGILFPGNTGVSMAAKELAKKGIQVYPIRAPTVPKGKERLRIVLHAHNSKLEIDRLIEALCSFCNCDSKLYSRI